jgi:hypothetical protein
MLCDQPLDDRPDALFLRPDAAAGFADVAPRHEGDPTPLSARDDHDAMS